MMVTRICIGMDLHLDGANPDLVKHFLQQGGCLEIKGMELLKTSL